MIIGVVAIILTISYIAFVGFMVIGNITRRYRRLPAKHLFVSGEDMMLNFINGCITLSIPKENQTPFLDVKKMNPELLLLEQHFPEIKKEALNLMNTKLNDIPNYGDVDGRNTGLSGHGDKFWKTFIFKYYKDWNDKNCALCPMTASVLKQIPGINLAMFSILEKGKVLYPHYGPFRAIGRVHLPIIIPSHGHTYIMVDGVKHYWKEGKLVMLDDTYIHSVDNPDIDGGCDRVVLFIDVYRSDIPKFWQKLAMLPEVEKYLNSVNAKTEATAAKHKLV